MYVCIVIHLCSTFWLGVGAINLVTLLDLESRDEGFCFNYHYFCWLCPNSRMEQKIILVLITESLSKAICFKVHDAEAHCVTNNKLKHGETIIRTSSMHLHTKQ